jgi:protein-S-isoprenylcysteine O-methyltransferase Ste14
MDAERRRRAIAWSFVFAQFPLIALLVIPIGPSWATPVPLALLGVALILLGGVAMLAAAAGLGAGLTASPVPNRAARLRTAGPYAWSRHPLYAGLLLAGAGVVIGFGSVLRLSAFVLLAVLLVAKARFEEARLAERFPDYPAYAARTPRFFPGLRRLRAPRR